jgi:hypothetical protein
MLAEEELVTMEPTPARSRLPERLQRAVPVVSPQQLDAEVKGPRTRERPWAPALRLVNPPKPIDTPNGSSTRAGPFRLSESWWDRPVDRDYYQLIDRGGSLLLVFRDLCDGRWYLQGVFD